LSTAVRIHVVGRNGVFSGKKKGSVSLYSQLVDLRRVGCVYFVVEGEVKVGSKEVGEEKKCKSYLGLKRRSKNYCTKVQ
jgi:hypothetical protein